MGGITPLALLLGSLALAGPAAAPPQAESPERFDAGGPGSAAAAEIRESELEVAPVDNGRPEEFWWPDPDELLRTVYGNCGLRECCKFCVIGKPCGNTCISRKFTCRVGCGCACQRPLVFVD